MLKQLYYACVYTSKILDLNTRLQKKILNKYFFTAKYLVNFTTTPVSSSLG